MVLFSPLLCVHQNLEQVKHELEGAVTRRQTVELMAQELKKEVARQKFEAYKVKTWAGCNVVAVCC